MDVQPKNPTAKGPTEWFTGDVWIDAIAQAHGPSPMSIGSVHFAPGARTAWHSHSIGQTRYVTEGEGRVQSRGRPTVTIRPGDVVRAPGGPLHDIARQTGGPLAELLAAGGLREAVWRCCVRHDHV